MLYEAARKLRGSSCEMSLKLRGIFCEISMKLRGSWSQDELVLIVPRGHSLASGGVVAKDGLYSLTFVSLNSGSSVQQAQEATLRKQGILWRSLKIDMVRRTRR